MPAFEWQRGFGYGQMMDGLESLLRLKNVTEFLCSVLCQDIVVDWFKSTKKYRGLHCQYILIPLGRINVVWACRPPAFSCRFPFFQLFYAIQFTMGPWKPEKLKIKPKEALNKVLSINHKMYLIIRYSLSIHLSLISDWKWFIDLFDIMPSNGMCQSLNFNIKVPNDV